MSEYYDLPDELFKELSEFYIKYINVKQDQANSYKKNSEGANKFNVLFDQIQKVIEKVVDSILLNKPFTCQGYQTRFTQIFKAELDEINNRPKLPNMLMLKKKIIEFIISLIEKIVPSRLPSYSLLSDAETCGSGYFIVIPQIINDFKSKIEKNAIPLIYGKIKDVAEEEIKNGIQEIDTVIGVLDGEKKDDIGITQIKEYITEVLEIPDQTENISSENIVNKLTEKYSEFLNIPTANFDQEIKNRIKKSVVEIVLIELKLKKIYNPKNPLLFSKAIKEFFEK